MDDEPSEGFDLRGWKVADTQGLCGADGTLDLQGAILCRVNLFRVELQGARRSCKGSTSRWRSCNRLATKPASLGHSCKELTFVTCRCKGPSSGMRSCKGPTSVIRSCKGRASWGRSYEGVHQAHAHAWRLG